MSNISQSYHGIIVPAGYSYCKSSTFQSSEEIFFQAKSTSAFSKGNVIMKLDLFTIFSNMSSTQDPFTIYQRLIQIPYGINQGTSTLSDGLDELTPSGACTPTQYVFSASPWKDQSFPTKGSSIWPRALEVENSTMGSESTWLLSLPQAHLSISQWKVS